MIIFVGLNPSKKNKDPKIPFEGTLSCETLDDWIYHTVPSDESYKVVNFFDELDYKQSNIDLDMVKRKLKGATRVIALGKVVHRLLTKLNIPHFEMPHPSPKNRKLNDKGFVRKQLSALRTFLSFSPNLTRLLDTPEKKLFGLYCACCGDVVVSLYRHDFRACKCGAIYVDGGTCYSRYGFTPGKDFRRVIVYPRQSKVKLAPVV